MMASASLPLAMSPHESMSRVIYEVNLKVHPSVIDEYKVWLVKHAHNMLKLEGIMSMTVSTLDDDEDGYKQLCIETVMPSMAHVQHYLTHHTAHMRAEVWELFGDKSKPTRRQKTVLFSGSSPFTDDNGVSSPEASKVYIRVDGKNPNA